MDLEDLTKLAQARGGYLPPEQQSLTSIAVSAKRQADALERIANAFDQQSASGNVLYWLEQIASAAQAGR